MKAAIYPGGGGDWRIETRPDPEPGPHDLIVAVHRCGICGTDLHMSSGHGFEFPAGCVPGHEFSGEVLALGREVTGWRLAARVAVLPSSGCGACEACARGVWTLCRNAPGLMGGFAEFARVPAASAVRLPDTLSLADGALVEPLAVGLHGVNAAALAPGARVLVLGAGSVGLAVAFWAKRAGARVVVTSRAGHRGAMALAMGADRYLADASAEALTEALGGAPHAVFECAGAAGMLARAIGLAAPFGEVISLGFCTTPDSLTPALAAMKHATVRFPLGYSLAEFETVARTFDAGAIDPARMVTATVPLAELPATIARLRAPNRETKVHIAP